jgi:hypothetical protein
VVHLPGTLCRPDIEHLFFETASALKLPTCIRHLGNGSTDRQHLELIDYARRTYIPLKRSTQATKRQKYFRETYSRYSLDHKKRHWTPRNILITIDRPPSPWLDSSLSKRHPDALGSFAAGLPPYTDCRPFVSMCRATRDSRLCFQALWSF